MFITQHRCIVQSILLTMLTLVAGCGGSGDDPPLSSGEAITAFSFTAEANPQLGADITGTIDEANGTILLTGPLDVDAVAGLKASFTTTGTQTQVSVGGVAQESGVTENSFAGPLTYRVTAEDGSTRDYQVHAAYWKHPSGPADGINPEGNASLLQVAMDSNGNAVIVWEQFDGSHYQIFKSEYRDGEWTHPEGLDDYISPDEGNASSPQVAMDSSGNAVIVWWQYDEGNIEQIFKSEYRDGEWTHPTGLSDGISPDGWSTRLPQVAMNSSGDTVIAWQQYDGSTLRIFKSEYRDGEWTHPEGLDDYISPDEGNASSPQVAMDSSGNAVIVWWQYDEGNIGQIFKSEYRDGEWTHPASQSDNISPDGQHAYIPQAAMDDSGNAVIVWYQYDGSLYQIFKSEYRGGEWTHPEGLDDYISPDVGNASLPQVAMDSSGNIVIVWYQYDGSLYHILKSEYRDGEWTHPEGFDDYISPDVGNAYLPQVAMDDSGNAVIVWQQYDGSQHSIFKSEYRGGEWTHPEGLDDYISPDGWSASSPQMAMDSSGNTVIVWYQSDGSHNQIFKSEYRFWEE